MATTTTQKPQAGGITETLRPVAELCEEIRRRNLSEQEQRDIFSAVMRLCPECVERFKTQLPAEGYGFTQAVRDQLHEWFVSWAHFRSCDNG